MLKIISGDIIENAKRYQVEAIVNQITNLWIMAVVFVVQYMMLLE